MSHFLVPPYYSLNALLASFAAIVSLHLQLSLYPPNLQVDLVLGGCLGEVC